MANPETAAPASAMRVLAALQRRAEPLAIFDRGGEMLFSSDAFDAWFESREEGERGRALAQLARALATMKADRTLQIGDDAFFDCRRASQDGDLWSVAIVDADRLARTDPLTGLGNRLVLRRAVADLYAREETDWSLLLFDLDRFKAVNDTLGHPIGDRLLCAAADRVKRCMGPRDLFARLGGDEFALLLHAPDPAQADAVSRRIVDLVSRSYLLDEHLVTVGASIGVARLSDGEGDPDRLLTRADLALYAAKASGRGRARAFEPALEQRAQERRALEQDLRRGVALRQFELFYQPQIDAMSGRMSGLEALVRWRHPTRGLVSPALFVPIAEESGAIVQLGEWILRTACRDAAAWPDDVTVAVNLSPIQVLDAHIVAAVVQSLAHSGLPARRLELEITESVLIRDTAAAFATLEKLKSLGVRIAMDDFGTGYSSLSHLRAFPFDKVKIDQSFVREMSTSADAAAIVKAIVDLGASLGMKVTAEGVETSQQMDMLRATGCGQLQGYLISRPVPLDQLGAFIKQEGR